MLAGVGKGKTRPSRVSENSWSRESNPVTGRRGSLQLPRALLSVDLRRVSLTPTPVVSSLVSGLWSAAAPGLEHVGRE